MAEARLTVHEPRVKVDLTKYVEHHAFSFDDVLDEEVSNDAVYRSTVQPLVATIFRSGKVSIPPSCLHCPKIAMNRVPRAFHSTCGPLKRSSFMLYLSAGDGLSDSVQVCLSNHAPISVELPIQQIQDRGGSS